MPQVRFRGTERVSYSQIKDLTDKDWLALKKECESPDAHAEDVGEWIDRMDPYDGEFESVSVELLDDAGKVAEYFDVED